MKKSLTLVATAAIAFSMFTSAALAETAKTASDYKDLAGVDAELKIKIDTLLSKGIFEGVSGDTFGISQNMTRAQFAKVAALVFGLQVDTTLQTSSFSDVRADDSANGWAIPYIEAAKKAGLIDGMTESTFAPGDNVTVGQLDTVFVKGLGKTVNVAANPWYTDAVKQAKELSIHPSDKGGDALASRADLVTGAYGSWQASQSSEEQAQVSVSSAKGSGDQAVQVTLDKEVDTAKAKLALTKDGTVVPTVTTWSSDKKSATLALSLDSKLSNGSYTVTLSGLDASTVKTASVTFTFGASASTGSIDFAITGSYDLSNVIDRGITAAATGTDGYATKAEAEDPTVSKFAKEITINATNTTGEEVALPGIIQSITSSNPSVVKAGVSSENKGYILGNQAGTATVNIVYSALNGDHKQMSIPVQVKDEAVEAKLIEARDSAFYQYVTVTGGVYAGQFNAYESMDLLVTDNFGIEYEQDEIQSYNFALGTVFIPEDIAGDPAKGSEGTVTIDNDGTVHINGNVTSFTLTAILPNNQRASADIKVLKN
ncbi:MAG: S-layer protein [Paenibacillus sp.]|jgi:hypothetical protein|nr:S-layer protein [Paenibacillus sp.]